MFVSDRHATILYNTSKANYNLRHFIIKQYIYRLITIIDYYETETFTCYTIELFR
jgi:hypothetical protein